MWFQNYFRDEVRIPMAKDLRMPKGKLGAKLWVLPPWYYKLHATGRTTTLALADFGSTVFTYPRMVDGGRSEFDKPLSPSGVSWTIGKGTLGQAIFSSQGGETFSLIHETNETQRLSTLPLHEYRKLPADTRLGMSRSDHKKISERYGAMVAAALHPHGNFTSKMPKKNARLPHALGCITAHIPSSITWDIKQIYIVSEWLLTIHDDVADAIVEQFKFSIPDAAELVVGKSNSESTTA